MSSKLGLPLAQVFKSFIRLEDPFAVVRPKIHPKLKVRKKRYNGAGIGKGGKTHG